MATTLHIGLYHPSILPVSRYGGTERVVVWLARALAALGHRVTVLALPGSRVPEATMVAIPKEEAFRPGGARLERYLPKRLDLLHSHVPLAEPPRSVPYWWTFHGTGAPGRCFPPETIGLSRDHAARHGLARWCYNGLDPADYRFTQGTRRHDLFIGRLHTAKGWQWALRGARATGHRIVLAGGWRPSLRRGVYFVGRIDGPTKAALLVDAGALWMPARWNEPFGLTIIEAMVSGIPVLGTTRGALPELITAASGRMGDTLEELIALRPELDTLDPEAVRGHVLERFTHLHMAEAYLRIYGNR